MIDLREFVPHGDAQANEIVNRAMQANRGALHARLMAWIGAHPDADNPTTHLAPEDGDPAVGRIVPRAEILEFLRGSSNRILRELGDTLSRMPPVPLGSIDVIVSTPRLAAIVRAAPSPEQAS
jgi:hypothetical protein